MKIIMSEPHDGVNMCVWKNCCDIATLKIQIENKQEKMLLCEKCFQKINKKASSMKSVHYKFEIPVRIMFEIDKEDSETGEEFEYKYFKQFNENVKQEIFLSIQNEFDGCWLEQHIHHESVLKNCVQTLRIVGMTEIGVICEAIVNRKLKPAEIKELAKYISDQCSDGWGESMEQVEKMIDGELCFIQTWWRDGYSGIKNISPKK
jgi:uncharacterized protein YlaI